MFNHNLPVTVFCEMSVCLAAIAREVQRKSVRFQNGISFVKNV